MKRSAATARGAGPDHASRHTTTGTIAIRKSESRFGSANTAAPRPTALAMGGDEDDTGSLRAFATIVLAIAQHAREVVTRLRDVRDAPRRFDPGMPGVVRRHRVRHVA